MCESKFRVWNIIENRYVEEKYNLFLCTDGQLFIETDCGLELANENNFIVEKFTGLLDKNKNEVFEGDIVYIDLRYHLVVFESGCFMLDNYNNGDYYQGDDPLCTDWNKAEAVGDIHGNSDLLND
jgi:hypothetical protein